MQHDRGFRLASQPSASKEMTGDQLTMSEDQMASVDRRLVLGHQSILVFTLTLAYL
jgi:hypothetical protein